MTENPLAHPLWTAEDQVYDHLLRRFDRARSEARRTLLKATGYNSNQPDFLRAIDYEKAVLVDLRRQAEELCAQARENLVASAVLKDLGD